MDPRTDFISKVDIQSTRVRSFRGFIFMCGGPHDIKKSPESLRSLLINEMTSGKYEGLPDRIKLAEEINDWFKDATYSDLVRFEEHLASLSSLIVLVVESGGAIAELGVFSSIEKFSDRLLTLVANSHYEQDSFIRLGPVQKLKNIDEDRVLVYDWIERDHLGRDRTNLSLLGADDVRGAVGIIRDNLSVGSSEKSFKWGDSLHVMLLICELCDLFGALAIREIDGYLKDLGGPVTQQDLKQYLFLLERCQLIWSKARSNKTYYYAKEWSNHISFSLGGAGIDRDRLRVDVFNYYRTSDLTRASVIKSVVANAA